MLQERMSVMHTELYGKYKELTEENMTLKQMYNKSILKAYDRDIAKAKVEGIGQVAKAMKAAGDT
ncbi:MAG: hypothetical protein FWC26_01705, partial [Fibromonadales bacterium]|nr:hypothetical protein [Fibromonadales bacterium]